MQSNPEENDTPTGLEWMLHNPAVGEADLLQAVLEAHGAELASFARLLDEELPAPGSPLNPHPPAPAPAWEQARQVVRELAAHRDRVSPGGGLRLHLFARLAARFAARARPRRSGEVSERLALTLVHGYGFSVGEAAAVLARPGGELAALVRPARLRAYAEGYPGRSPALLHPEIVDALSAGERGEAKEISAALDDHLQTCPACREYAAHLADLEAGLSARWAPPPVEAAPGLPGRVEGKSAGRRVFWKEMGLVVGLLALLIFAGSRLGVLEPQDARLLGQAAQASPTPSPSPSPSPARAAGPTRMPTPDWGGVENQDYFLFTSQFETGTPLEGLVGGLGVTVEEIRQLNNLRPGEPVVAWQDFYLAARRSSGSFDLQPPATRLRLPPLTAASTLEEVVERIRLVGELAPPFWSDSVFFPGGLPSFTGPPLEYQRLQNWAGSPQHMLIVLERGQAGEVETTRAFFVGGFGFILQPDDPQIRGFHVPVEVEPSFFLFFMGRTTDLLEDADLALSGPDRVAGRDTLGLVVSHPEMGRLHLQVDAHTGLILRLEALPPTEEAGPQRLLFRLETLQVVYNPTLPDDLFFPPLSPYQELASGPHGRPLGEAGELDWLSLLGKTPLPVNGGGEALSYPVADLSFQRLELSGPIQVFAGQTYLGEFNPGAQALHGCTRSPQGDRALLSLSRGAFFPDSSALYLLELRPFSASLITEHTYGQVTGIFSPDGSTLAYTSCATQCRLYLRHIESGAVTSTSLSRPNQWSGSLLLIWSPDQKQIAVLEGDRLAERNLTLVDVELGEKIFTGSYSWESGEISPAGSPLELWDPPFQPPSTISNPDC
jgi:hypothetical protein